MNQDNLPHRLVNLEERVGVLEDQHKFLLLEQHSLDKQLVEIRSDLKYIKLGQDSINNTLGKVLWAFGGGFIAAIVAFIAKGGLNAVL